MEDIQKKAEQLENEVKAAKEQAAEAQAKAEALAAEVAKKNEEINNLDASIKEQEKSIKELRLEVKTSKVVDFKTAFRNALEEKRDELTTKFKSGESFSMELKSVVNVGVSTAITGNGLSLQQDTTVAGAPYATNVFLLAFGVQPRTANKLSWIEATSQNAAGYLTELVANANKSDVQFAEKQRNFAKVGTYMTISTEVSDWFEQIYNFCVNEGAKMVADKIDALIASGVGADGTKPNEIYGLESQSTAFTALAAGKVENANIADVIIDASEQISKEGFVANAAFLPWALHAELKTLKDKQGNYLYDQATGMLQGIRIYPTSHMSAGKVLVADTNCASIVAGNSYELEFERNASIDGFNVYFRQAVQTKVKTPNKKGLVLATATTAIAALLKSV